MRHSVDVDSHTECNSHTFNSIIGQVGERGGDCHCRTGQKSNTQATEGCPCISKIVFLVGRFMMSAFPISFSWIRKELPALGDSPNQNAKL
jgi:hypothetical protein